VEGWVCIFTSGDHFHVTIKQHLLESHDIQVIQISKKDSNYLFGFFELHVRNDDVMRANHLIAASIDE
jgi:hypothetical protein